MKHIYTTLFVLALLTACTSETETDLAKSYFDLKGFIETQVTELNKRKPLVSKTMTMGTDKDSISTTAIDWAKELELFTQADLNKQAYQLSYEITQPNPFTFEYVLKSGEKLTVKSLKVVVDETSKQPKLIEALLKEENKLYDSEKQLSLTCTLRPEGIWLIKTYEISGFQHLTMADKKDFSVKGVIK
jgi:hypothetical protein